MSRGRFVDRDGRSFFDEVDHRRDVWLRYEPFEPSFAADSTPGSLVVRREVYRRELRHLPYGPYAAPMVMRDGGIVDVVYRFDSEG